MTKLDDCWESHGKAFRKVSDAVYDLLESLIDCAVKKGVPEKTARDTYIDWVRQKMREEDFMT